MSPFRRRRLAAILAADLVGFVRHMQRSEDHAFDVLAEHQGCMSDVAKRFSGRLVDTPGDFLLCEFYSARDAIEAALVFRETLSTTNLDQPPPQYRYGIDLGDVVDIGDAVHGNTVNVAARLQQNAAPGQILISQIMFEVIRYQDGLQVDFVGTRRFKNINRSVRVFAVSRRAPSEAGHAIAASSSWDSEELRSGRPILQVTRFASSRNDADSAFFAKALHTEIMATLEPLRHAVATQEGLESSSGADVYRIDGTLHFGETTYITPCLTRISDGETIWASRYRYTQEEGFDAVVRIVSDVVAALQIKLTEGEQAGIWRARTASVEAWECFQRAHHLERRYRPDLHQRAVELYERSLRLDGSYIVAIAALGFCLLDQYRLGWIQDATSALKRAEALAEQALALDPDFPDAVALRGFTLLLQGQTDEALAKARRAIDLAPQSVEMIAYFGAMLRYIGRADDAVATYRRAIRLSPHPAPWLLVNMGNAYLEGGRLFEAIAAFGQITDAYPDHLRAHLGLVIAYMRSGRIEDAKAAAQTACRIEPTFVASEYTSARAHSDPAAAQALIDDLVAAGLPRDR